MKAFLVAFALWLLITAPVQAAEDMFHHSGQPIPRFVSLKSDEINVRVGPGKRYPIEWVYHRKHWPVEVVEEFGHWRRIRDHEGTLGWVHKSLLGGARSAIILGEQRPLYAAPDARSGIAFEAKPLTHGLIIACTPQWCQLEMQGHRGWIRRDAIWGVYQNEVIEED